MKAIFAAAALLLAAACSDAGGPAGPAGAIRVRTDASGYRLPGNGSQVVRFTVRNTGSEPIVVGSCGGATVAGILDRREAGEWVEEYSCAYLPIYALPHVLAPGEVIDGETSVLATGRYRIRVPVSVGQEEGAESLDALSPDFIVVH
ncbi:MAG: hypothetical protein ACJ8GN_26380 [Longimicrobiaceae bacterium]